MSRTERDSSDPTRRCRRLQVKLRQLMDDGEDTVLGVSIEDLVLLDRGLAALVDCYTHGKDDRAAMARLKLVGRE